MTWHGAKLVLAALLALTGLGLAHPESATAVDEPTRIRTAANSGPAKEARPSSPGRPAGQREESAESMMEFSASAD